MALKSVRARGNGCQGVVSTLPFRAKPFLALFLLYLLPFKRYRQKTNFEIFLSWKIFQISMGVWKNICSSSLRGDLFYPISCYMLVESYQINHKKETNPFLSDMHFYQDKGNRKWSKGDLFYPT